MSDYGREQFAANSTKGSRIMADIERMQQMTKRVHDARERVMRHSSALGYYADTPPTEASAKVSPISNTLSNALSDLDRALDQLSGALNVFD